MPSIQHEARALLQPDERWRWRIAQGLAWSGALALLIALAFTPDAGLLMMWDVVLPLAPVLMAIMPGLWRNICPLGTTAQLPRHFGFSAARPLSEKQQVASQTVGLVLLLLVVPLRHVSLNVDAAATMAALLIAGGLALVGGFLFSGKSGWCTGACPVHPVEKLYGQAPAFTVWNAHCASCLRCTTICPDSTRSMSPLTGKGHPWRIASAWLLVGGFPGYIWGWFHVRDYGYAATIPGAASERIVTLAIAYGLPFGAMAVSLAVYVVLMKMLPRNICPSVSRTFAALAISTYYWYRLPALIGHGVFPGDGMLIDLTTIVPAGAMLPLQLAAAAFFFWWLVVRTPPAFAWQIRPPFAPEASAAHRAASAASRPAAHVTEVIPARGRVQPI